jgi:ATP synthase protein I
MVAKILVRELEEPFDLKGLHLKARRAALSIVVVQFGATLLISAVGFLMGGPRTAISALMGGGIGTLGSLCMVVSIFRLGEDVEPETILKRVYRGEFLKLALTVVLFGLVLKSIEVSFGAMLGCFAVTLLVYWAALLRSPI